VSIGSQIRTLRRKQMRTLDEIARACGFTKSLLSKIENEATMPPVATLTRIAAALNVSVSTLMDDATHAAKTVFTPADDITPKRFTRTDKGYAFFMFAAGRAQKSMQPFLFTARKGEVKAKGLSHSGEEFIYLLEGKMRYRVGSVAYTLAPGDSLYFDAEEEHELEPLSATVKYLAIFTERKHSKE